MRPHCGTAAALVTLACLAFTASASAVTLVNDPDAPYPADQLALLQKWADRSHVPTVTGTVLMTNTDCPNPVAVGCAGSGHIWLSTVDREALMHELGHEWEYVTPADRLDTLQRLTHTYGEFWAKGGPNETVADAYMRCSIRPSWTRWWGAITHHHGVTTYSFTPTSYDFRAGPERYSRICAAFR